MGWSRFQAEVLPKILLLMNADILQRLCCSTGAWHQSNNVKDPDHNDAIWIHIWNHNNKLAQLSWDGHEYQYNSTTCRLDECEDLIHNGDAFDDDHCWGAGSRGRLCGLRVQCGSNRECQEPLKLYTMKICCTPQWKSEAPHSSALWIEMQCQALLKLYGGILMQIQYSELFL